MEYIFKGEATITGALSLLGQKLPQEELTSALLDQIWEEIDTEYRLVRLTQQIEDCIVFLVQQQAKSAIQNEMKLSSFIIDILMIDSSVWNDLCGPTIATSVHLKHIKSLLDGLRERKLQGNIFTDLPSKYRTPLTSAHIESLQVFLPKCPNTHLLLSALKDFLLMLSQSELTFIQYIYDNLPYIGEGLLADCSWYDDYFPRDITLEYAYEVYTWIKKHA